MSFWDKVNKKVNKQNESGKGQQVSPSSNAINVAKTASKPQQDAPEYDVTPQQDADAEAKRKAKEEALRNLMGKFK